MADGHSGVAHRVRIGANYALSNPRLDTGEFTFDPASGDLGLVNALNADKTAMLTVDVGCASSSGRTCQTLADNEIEVRFTRLVAPAQAVLTATVGGDAFAHALNLPSGYAAAAVTASITGIDGDDDNNAFALNNANAIVGDDENLAAGTFTISVDVTHGGFAGTLKLEVEAEIAEMVAAPEPVVCADDEFCFGSAEDVRRIAGAGAELNLASLEARNIPHTYQSCYAFGGSAQAGQNPGVGEASSGANQFCQRGVAAGHLGGRCIINRDTSGRCGYARFLAARACILLGRRDGEQWRLSLYPDGLNYDTLIGEAYGGNFRLDGISAACSECPAGQQSFGLHCAAGSPIVFAEDDGGGEEPTPVLREVGVHPRFGNDSGAIYAKRAGLENPSAANTGIDLGDSGTNDNTYYELGALDDDGNVLGHPQGASLTVVVGGLAAGDEIVRVDSVPSGLCAALVGEDVDGTNSAECSFTVPEADVTLTMIAGGDVEIAHTAANDATPVLFRARAGATGDFTSLSGSSLELEDVPNLETVNLEVTPPTGQEVKSVDGGVCANLVGQTAESSCAFMRSDAAFVTVHFGAPTPEPVVLREVGVYVDGFGNIGQFYVKREGIANPGVENSGFNLGRASSSDDQYIKLGALVGGQLVDHPQGEPLTLVVDQVRTGDEIVRVDSVPSGLCGGLVSAGGLVGADGTNDEECGFTVPEENAVLTLFAGGDVVVSYTGEIPQFLSARVPGEQTGRTIPLGSRSVTRTNVANSDDVFIIVSAGSGNIVRSVSGGVCANAVGQGTATCDFKRSEASAVVFDIRPPQGEVTYADPTGGEFAVSSGSDADLDSGDSLDVGAKLTATATPASGNYVLRWTGDCATPGEIVDADADSASAAARSCELTMDADGVNFGVVFGNNECVTANTCTTGQTCVDPNHEAAGSTLQCSGGAATEFPLTYTQPVNGVLAVRSGGSNVASGGNVAEGALLTVDVTPTAGSAYVRSWTGACADGVGEIGHEVNVGQVRRCVLTMRENLSFAAVVWQDACRLDSAPSCASTQRCVDPDHSTSGGATCPARGTGFSNSFGFTHNSAQVGRSASFAGRNGSQALLFDYLGVRRGVRAVLSQSELAPNRVRGYCDVQGWRMPTLGEWVGWRAADGVESVPADRIGVAGVGTRDQFGDLRLVPAGIAPYDARTAGSDDVQFHMPLLPDAATDNDHISSSGVRIAWTSLDDYGYPVPVTYHGTGNLRFNQGPPSGVGGLTSDATGRRIMCVTEAPGYVPQPDPGAVRFETGGNIVDGEGYAAKALTPNAVHTVGAMMPAGHAAGGAILTVTANVWKNRADGAGVFASYGSAGQVIQGVTLSVVRVSGDSGLVWESSPAPGGTGTRIVISGTRPVGGGGSLSLVLRAHPHIGLYADLRVEVMVASAAGLGEGVPASGGAFPPARAVATASAP